MLAIRRRLFALVILAIPRFSAAADAEELPLYTDGSHLMIDAERTEKLIRRLAHLLLAAEELTSDSDPLELIEKINSKLPESRRDLSQVNLTPPQKGALFVLGVLTAVGSFYLGILLPLITCAEQVCPDDLELDGSKCVNQSGNVTTNAKWRHSTAPTACVAALSTTLPLFGLTVALACDVSCAIDHQRLPLPVRMWRGLLRQYRFFFDPVRFRLSTSRGIDGVEKELGHYADFLRITGGDEPTPELSVLEI